MTKADVRSALLDLPPDDRLELVEEVWEGLEAEWDPKSLSAEQRELLADRLADYKANPGDTLSWEEARAEIEAES